MLLFEYLLLLVAYPLAVFKGFPPAVQEDPSYSSVAVD
jgi:hypothetical protein